MFIIPKYHIFKCHYLTQFQIVIQICSNLLFYIMLVFYVGFHHSLNIRSIFVRNLALLKVAPIHQHLILVFSLELFLFGGVDKHPLFVGLLFGYWNATSLSPTSYLRSSRSNKCDIKDSAMPTTMVALISPTWTHFQTTPIIYTIIYQHNIKCLWMCYIQCLRWAHYEFK